MTARARSRWGLSLGGAVLLGAAMPPALVPGGEFLVLPGLMAWYALATGSGRPLRDSYLFGCLFMAWFSWSVRHVLLPAYFAIVVLGGLYFVLGTAAVRGWPQRARGIAFAVAVAATFWLRSVMPEIYYPHGQPCHCLWQWPALLSALPIGGEPLCNALLGGLAAAGVGVWRSWRVGAPEWGAAWRALAAWFAAAVLASLPGAFAGPSSPSDERPAVSIAMVESGVNYTDIFAGLTEREQWQRYDEVVEARLIAPTRELLAAPESLDLILWPESSLWERPKIEDLAAGRVRLLGERFRAAPTRLLLGDIVRRGRPTPAAFLIGLPEGTILGRHEKQRLVPGGEFLPLVHWLPESWLAVVHDAFAAALGTPPDCLPGEPLPPLATASGVKFGALLCYDNAFPEPAARLVADGAQFLCVLSNETWYRRGAELWQLAAMTVCRAIELQTPIVRCTTDGWTLAVDAGGRIVESLPVEAATPGAARILRARVQTDPQRQRPMAWHRAAAGPGLAILLLLALLHGALRWARLRGARTSP